MRDVNEDDSFLQKHLKPSKNSMDVDNFILYLMKEIYSVNTRLKHTRSEGELGYPQFKELNQDLFAAFYKYLPKITPENKMDYNYLLNHKVVEEIIKTNQYKELRSITRTDEIATTAGMEVVAEEVKKIVKELLEEYKKAQDAMKKAQDAMDSAQGNTPDGEGEGNGDGEEGNPTDKKGKGKGKAKISLEKAKEMLEKARSQMKDVTNKVESRAIKKMLEKAINTARETSDMITNWGIQPSETFSKQSYQSTMELLDRIRNSSKLKEIANLAGRYRRMATQAQQEKIVRGMSEIYDVKPGGDIGRILPSEKLKLVNKITNLLFKKALLENSVLQYETRGKEKKARGPVVILIDNSGSMSGQPEVWAKAAALGVLEICKMQKRDMYVIHFDSSSKQHLHCNFFPKNDYKIMEIIDMCEYFSGGQ